MSSNVLAARRSAPSVVATWGATDRRSKTFAASRAASSSNKLRLNGFEYEFKCDYCIEIVTDAESQS